MYRDRVTWTSKVAEFSSLATRFWRLRHGPRNWDRGDGRGTDASCVSALRIVLGELVLGLWGYMGYIVSVGLVVRRAGGEAEQGRHDYARR